MSDWLERLRAVTRAPERAPDTAQSRRVEGVLGDRVLHASDAGWLDAVDAALGDRPVDPRTLELLVALRVSAVHGDLTDEEAAAHLGFWRRLAGRAPGDPVLQAHLADVELALGDAAAALRRFVDAFDARPELFGEFGWDLEEDAREVGGDVLFRWQLHHLRWVLAGAVDGGESGDEAREVYGALLDEYRDEPARLAALHPLGDEIRRLEVAGDLPRAMVVRQRRRPRGEAEG